MSFLVGCFIQLLVIQAGSLDVQLDNLTLDSAQSANQISAGVVVAIDPDKLFGEGLSRAWRNINECKDGIVIQGRPFSKVHFVIKPVESIDGATLQVFLRGSSAGITKSSTSRVEIESDSLTHFKAKQWIHLSTGGMGFAPPEINVKANQSFKKSTGKKNGIAAVFASAAYRHFPRDFQIKSQKIATELVQKQMHESMRQLEHALVQAVERFEQAYPAISRLPWQLASDSRNVYLFSSESYDAGTEILPVKETAAVMIDVGESSLNDYAREMLGRREVNSEQFKSFFRRNFRDKRKETGENTKPWSLQFKQEAIVFSFVKNKINVKINAAKIKAAGREIENMAAKFGYEVHYQGSRWSLKRDGIEVFNESGGARQQMVRSIIRQRLDSIIPEEIVIPELNHIDALRRLDLELEVKSIEITPDIVQISIDHQ